MFRERYRLAAHELLQVFGRFFPVERYFALIGFDLRFRFERCRPDEDHGKENDGDP